MHHGLLSLALEATSRVSKYMWSMKAPAPDVYTQSLIKPNSTSLPCHFDPKGNSYYLLELLELELETYLPTICTTMCGHNEPPFTDDPGTRTVLLVHISCAFLLPAQEALSPGNLPYSFKAPLLLFKMSPLLSACPCLILSPVSRIQSQHDSLSIPYPSAQPSSPVSRGYG